MANYFVDSSTGDNGDDGTTMDLAWATVEYALEAGGLSAGDIVWVRRIHSEIPITDIVHAYDGTVGSPISVIGWARAAIPDTTITAADWTNGNPLVDNVAGITPDREKHIGRYCTAPDGSQYLITAVIYEAGVDGMGAGDEFVVGDILTNVTQTKKGKVWGFTDNLDTTGTIQYVRDSSSAWVEDDNITSDGGGDAEIDAGGETAVGFLIDREYPGNTVTGINGKFQIEEDEDYDLAQAIDDSGWTITKATYNADADDLPLIDFNDANLQIVVTGDLCNLYKNIEFKDSTDALGIIGISDSGSFKLEGCLIKQSTQSDPLLRISSTSYSFERIIFEGSGAGTTQVGVISFGSRGKMKACAVYNCGDYGIQSEEYLELDNVNFGEEMANGDDEFGIVNLFGQIVGNDVKLGGTNGYVYMGLLTNQGKFSRVSIGNFQKVLGEHVTYFPGGAIGSTGGMRNVDVGDANAPSAASSAGTTADLIALYPNINGYEFIEDWAVKVAEWKVWAPASAETYTVYLQNNMGVTLNDTTAKDDIWLKLTYIDTYDDATEYSKTELFSTEIDILQRADQTDWDSLTIANHTPAVAGWAVLELYVSKYVASGQIYVDPEWV